MRKFFRRSDYEEKDSGLSHGSGHHGGHDALCLRRGEGVPSSVEAATLNKIEVLNDEDGVPYFQLEIKFPKSYMDLYNETDSYTDDLDECHTWIDYYWKIDDGSWENIGSELGKYILDPTYNQAPAVSGQPKHLRIPYIYQRMKIPPIRLSSKIIHIPESSACLSILCRVHGVLFVSPHFSNELSIGSGTFIKIYRSGQKRIAERIRSGPDPGYPDRRRYDQTDHPRGVLRACGTAL